MTVMILPSLSTHLYRVELERIIIKSMESDKVTLVIKILVNSSCLDSLLVF